ncbi:unnamed protein product [Peniophora sp. CBMAI 1063]|nr:unnamed protein product [Peniophora sp. CBMAI 1063]
MTVTSRNPPRRLSVDGFVKASRARVRVVPTNLRPASELVDAHFLKAALQCMQGHHDAWLSGIHHQYVNLFNLQYRVNDLGDISGVLVDWDLAPDCSWDRRSGRQPPWTLPFMALDFLAEPDGGIEYLYRHSLEEFFWILVWMCHPRGTFRSWTADDFEDDCWKKLVFLHNGKYKLRARHGFEGVKAVVEYGLLLHFLRGHNRRCKETLALRKAKRIDASTVMKVSETAPQQSWRHFCDALRGALDDVLWRDNPDIASILEEFLETKSLAVLESRFDEVDITD